MAEKTVPYVVRDGDYLASIAHAHGITVADIWNDGMNSALRKLRSSPDMLAPGDVLYVPVVKRKWIRLNTGSTNVLVATVPTVSVEIKLRQAAEDGSNLLPILQPPEPHRRGLMGGDVKRKTPVSHPRSLFWSRAFAFSPRQTGAGAQARNLREVGL